MTACNSSSGYGCAQCCGTMGDWSRFCASLLLRQRLLEDVFDKDPSELAPFVESFSVCRNIRDAARLLNVNNHPDLLHIDAQGLHPTRYYKVLHSVVYRSDFDTPDMDLASNKRRHLQDPGKEQREALKAMPKRPRRSAEDVLASQFVDNLRLLAWSAEGVGSFILARQSDPPAPSRDLAQALAPIGGGFAGEAFGDDGMPPALVEEVCFKIVDAHPNRKHVIPTALVAGARMSARAIVVTVHDIIASPSAQRMVVSQEPARPVAGDGVGAKIMDNFDHADWGLVRSSWKLCIPSGESCVFFRDISASDFACDWCVVALVVDRLIEARAFPRCAVGHKCVEGSETDALMEMQRLGLVEQRAPIDMGQDPRPAWCFTLVGMRRLSFGVALPLSGQSALGDIRPGIALEGMTCYELMLRLSDDGWRWRPMTARIKGTSHRIADDQELLWYSGTAPERLYLVALLSGPSLRERFGITDIPHHGPPGMYRDLLRGVQPDPAAMEGIVSVAPWVADDMLLDIEAPAIIPALDDAAAGGHEGAHESNISEESDAEPAGSNRQRASKVRGAEEKESQVEGADTSVPSVENMLGGNCRWGCFLCTKKRQGYQATCPWDKKNMTSGCKKTITASKVGGSEEAILRLKFW